MALRPRLPRYPGISLRQRALTAAALVVMAQTGGLAAVHLPGSAAAVPTGPGHSCGHNLAGQLRSTDGAEQLVTVEASGTGTSVATVYLWQRWRSCWQVAAGPWPSLIGVNGFSDHHREGDGTTPTGIYRLGRTVYGTQPNPGYRGPYHRLVCGDWWDEDPTSPRYNTFQHVPCGTRPPFGGDSEALWTEGRYYPSFAVVEYNVHPVVPYAGSAIFVHASTGAPTTGCVSIPLGDLDWFLGWLRPSPSAAIVMAPTSELTRF